MKNQNRLPRFCLQLLIAAALITVVLAPITGSADTDNLYVTANQGGGTIFEYDAAGAQSTFAVVNPKLPRGLAFDSNGNLFVAATRFPTNNHGTLLKFTPSGVQTNFGGASGFLEGVAINSAGNVFLVSVNNTTFASAIFEFTPGGTRSVFGSLPGQTFGLAFDSSGNLFAADFSDQTIFKFTPGGTRTVFAGPAVFGDSGPSGLAFNSAGNLFVSTVGVPADNAILEFTPGGTESTFATGLNGPRGLAFDSAGNLFVADLDAGDVLKFTPTGTESVFASGIRQPQFLTFGPARGPAGPNLPDSGSTFVFLSVALLTLICLYRRIALIHS